MLPPHNNLGNSSNPIPFVKIAVTLLCLSVGAGIQVSRADFEYTTFSNPTALNLVGDATLTDGCLRLTPAESMRTGAAWHNVPQNVADGFETTFQLQITDLGESGADGLAFVIQNASASAIGGTGHGIGYGNSYSTSGIANSLAIEFDNFWNTAGGIGDPNGNHISVQSRSMLPNDPNHAYSLGSMDQISTLEDGNVHTVKIVYQASALRIYLDNPDTPVLVVALDLSALLQLADGENAWVGFTAATGSYFAKHDILSWEFDGSGGSPDCPGDVNGDNDVDIHDLASLLAVYGTCAGNPDFNPNADFNGSGCIELADLAALLAQYGIPCE